MGQKIEKPQVQKDELPRKISPAQEIKEVTIVEIPKKAPTKELQKEEILETPEKTSHPNNQEKTFSFPAFIMGLKTTTLVTDVKGARFELRENTNENKKSLHLIFSKKWNFDRVNIAKSKNTLVESLQNIFGGNWSIECTLDTGSDNSLHNAVHEIF